MTHRTRNLVSNSRTRLDRNGKLVGFIEFENIEDASRCRDSMQGTSPFPGINWHIHFSNNTQGRPAGGGSAPKRPREETGPPVPRHEAQRQSFGCACTTVRASHRAFPLSTLSAVRASSSRLGTTLPLLSTEQCVRRRPVSLAQINGAAAAAVRNA